MHNEIYLKIKRKSYHDKKNSICFDNRMPKKGCHCVCLAIILIDSVFNMGENCFPQVFSEECKFEISSDAPNYFDKFDKK